MKRNYRIVESYEGDETIVADNLHTFDEVKQTLIDANLYEWIKEEDLEFEIPDFETCLTWQGLGYELEEINTSMSWWSVLVQQEIDGFRETINPRYVNGWHCQ